MMTNKPILFSAPMIQALLDGRKTQTRRAIKLDGYDFTGYECTGRLHDCTGGHGLELVSKEHGLWQPESNPNGRSAWYIRVPIMTGDRLWVRETWRTDSDYYNDLAPSEMSGEELLIFAADADWSDNKSVGRSRASMHMPRWASRLTLNITDVRVQRLQDISEADARSEGVSIAIEDSPSSAWFSGLHQDTNLVGPMDGWHCNDAMAAFRDLWNSINDPDAWGENKWVAAYTFTVSKGNIDNG
jgi:hypothetical protein